jgi:hypothetical protein
MLFDENPVAGAVRSGALRQIALLSEHASALAQAAVATTYTR